MEDMEMKQESALAADTVDGSEGVFGSGTPEPDVCPDVPFETFSAEKYRKVENPEHAACDGYKVLKTVCFFPEEAEELLELLPEKVIVGYRCAVPDSDEMCKVTGRIATLAERRKKLLEERSVRSFSSAKITCKKCGSQLAKEFLKDDFCPLCGNDLRSASVLESIAQMDASIKELEDELKVLRLVNRLRNGQVVYLCRK